MAAQKRMFDRSIIETDNFLNISLTAKALYFLLGMEADDEGFVSPNRVLRLYGGEYGDIKNLVDTGLLIPFENGVVVITHWNQNNYLNATRIRPTQYQKELNSLLLTEQKTYELNKCSTRIEENSIEQSRIEENRVEDISIQKEKINYKNEFEFIWELYNFKKGKKSAYDKFVSLMKKETNPAKTIIEIKKSIPNYHTELSNKTWLQQQQLEFWLNKRRWEDEWETTKKATMGNVIHAESSKYGNLEITKA